MNFWGNWTTTALCSPGGRRFCLLIFVVVFLALSVGGASLQAQTRTEKSSARKLMLELSEDESEAENDADFDWEEDDSSDQVGKTSVGSKKTGKKSKLEGSAKSKKTPKSKETAQNASLKKTKASQNQTGQKAGQKSGQKAGQKTGQKGKGKKKNKEPEDLRTPEEKERDRLKYFEQTGIWRWPELTQTQYESVVKKQKEYLEEIKATFPQTVYYESEHFFYLTDAPKGIATECLKYLEAMFTRLCQIFEFPPGATVWNGKCIVCAFVFQQQFNQFEQKFFSQFAQEFSGASGLAHLSGDGNVLISLFYGDVSSMEARWKFIGILVHETTHGFMHRYRARQKLPLWLEEGIADSMPVVIVPADRQTFLKQRSGLEQMRTTGSVGGLMTAQERIEVWQYGIASGLVMFLIKQDSHKFKRFLDDVKDGKEWETALRDHYGCSAEELLFHFGRANRVPRLTF